MAASVIDAFLVELGLDASKYTQGRKNVDKEDAKFDEVNKRRFREEQRRDQQRERAQRTTTDNYRKMRNEVLLLASVFTAGVGIKNFITDTINSAATLGYLSDNLSMSTERIKAMQLASEMAGGTQEGLTAQLKESVESIAALNSGLGPNEAIQNFFRYGGSSRDLKDGNTFLLARSKIIADLFKVDPGRAALIAKQMGISEDQFNFIKQGPAAIEELIAAQEKHAAVSRKDAQAALELRNRMLELRNSLQETATRIVLQLAPALERLFARLEKIAEWVALHQNDIGKWIEDAVTGVTSFVQWVDRAAESVGGWKTVLLALVGIKVLAWTASIVQMTAALVALAGATPAAAAGVALLGKAGAVGAAGVAGYAAGSAAYNFLPETVRDGIGELIARTMASLGISNEAAYAVNSTKGKQLYHVDPAFLAPPKATPASPPATPKPPRQQPVPTDAQARLQALEAKYGLPRGLLDSVWAQESGRGKNMLSPDGAEGHFQFMPATAREFGLKDPYDFDTSADAAARKFQGLLKQYGGDLNKSLAAYNFGQGNLARTGMAGVPKETREYVSKIGATMQQSAAPGQQRPTTGAGSTVHSEVRIDNLNVNTQARDAEGIARSIKPAVERYSFGNSANTGMTP